MRGLSLLCGLVLLQATVSSSQWSPGSYPNPQTQPSRCGRSHVQRSWVCDPDGLLSKHSGDVIEGILKSIAAAEHPYAQARECGGRRQNAGYQVAFALAKDLAIDGEGRAAEDFAADLMDKWGVGDSFCNDGVLLLLSLQPRQVAIYAGRGAKRQVTEGRIKQIIARMRPLLREQKFGDALQGAAVDIGVALAGGPPPPGSGSGGTSLGSIISILFFLGVFVTILISIITNIGRSRSEGRHVRRCQTLLEELKRNRSEGRRVRRCQSLLEKLKREQAAALSNQQYPSESCPVCLEDFQLPPNDSRPSAPPLPFDGDGKDLKVPVREASRSNSSADLKARLLGGSHGQASSSSSSDRPEARERSCKPLVLPCGHSFCEDCLGKWIASNDTCPICRASLTERPLPPAPASCLPQQQQQQQAGAMRGGVQQMADYRIEEQLLFRLGSVQRMFPQVVTGDVMSSWERQVRRGEPLNWAAVRAAELSYERQQHHASSGAWGASTSFGGGTSTGGGGASGSW